MIISNNTLLQKKFWVDYKKNNISIFNGVPFTYTVLKKLNFFNKKNNIKIFTKAGGRLSENLQVQISNFCNKNKSKFFIMYGQAEATTRISYLPSKYSGSKIGSVGKAIKGGKISILRRHFGL